jgi:multidrug efflux pump subunit AcrB
MAKFFIDRPIFAWVIAIILMMAGGTRHLESSRCTVPHYCAAIGGDFG